MRKAAFQGPAIVLTHAAATLPHAIAHQAIPVPTPPLQSAFIAVVIVVAPLVAAALLWTRLEHLGARLLLASMTGSLAFGLYYHFVAPGPDHVSQVPADGWGMLFRVSAVLLLVTEGAGCWIGAWALNETRRGAGRLRAAETPWA